MNFDLFSIISTIFKYLFILVVYYFIINILKDILTYFTKESKNRITIIRIIEGSQIVDVPIINNFTLGRGVDNDYTTKDLAVSKRHFQIIDNGEEIFIVDQKSSNGTFINGKEIKRAVIKKGDIISIGGAGIRIEVMKWGRLFLAITMFFYFKSWQSLF